MSLSDGHGAHSGGRRGVSRIDGSVGRRARLLLRCRRTLRRLRGTPAVWRDRHARSHRCGGSSSSSSSIVVELQSRRCDGSEGDAVRRLQRLRMKRLRAHCCRSIGRVDCNSDRCRSLPVCQCNELHVSRCCSLHRVFCRLLRAHETRSGKCRIDRRRG